jgi:CheY-like chemotaxis protein
MHGTITAESIVNEGTLFRVLLPATGLTTCEEEESTKKPREQIHFQGATVLLVEDDAPNREVVRAFTADCDLRLIEAENGQEVLHMLKPKNAGTLLAAPPDLILMDLRMPVMDGYTATQKIRNPKSEIRNIPIVALTAYATKEQVEQYQDLFNAYLTKPISKRELLATLARFLPHTKTSGQKTGQEEKISPLKRTQRAVDERNMLEELKAYAVHSGPFPQAFLNTLHVELLPKHKETSELMSVDDMIAFAEAVIAVAEAFTITPLKNYGEELLRFTKVFDVINMKHLLALFPEIVEILSTSIR